MESTGGWVIFGEVDKNYMKIAKSTFFGQNSRGTWGYKPIWGVVGGFSQSLLPTHCRKH